MSNLVEDAHVIGRRRATVAPFAGAALLSVQQWLFFSRDWSQVAGWQLAAWLGLTVLVLAACLTGGLWLVPREIRALSNDEVTRRNRSDALATGFVVAITMSLLVFAIAPIEPISAQRAAHLISSIAMGVVLLVFGIKEARDHD